MTLVYLVIIAYVNDNGMTFHASYSMFKNMQDAEEFKTIIKTFLIDNNYVCIDIVTSDNDPAEYVRNYFTDNGTVSQM